MSRQDVIDDRLMCIHALERRMLALMNDLRYREATPENRKTWEDQYLVLSEVAQELRQMPFGEEERR